MSFSTLLSNLAGYTATTKSTRVEPPVGSYHSDFFSISKLPSITHPGDVTKSRMNIVNMIAGNTSIEMSSDEDYNKLLNLLKKTDQLMMKQREQF